jgi:hypothetical protein
MYGPDPTSFAVGLDLAIDVNGRNLDGGRHLDRSGRHDDRPTGFDHSGRYDIQGDADANARGGTIDTSSSRNASEGPSD